MTIFDNYRFGVEIEFTGALLRTVETEMQAILAGTNIEVALEGYNHTTSAHWKITTDNTVSENYSLSTGDGFGGELVSPVLEGEAGLLELKKVLEALNSVQGVTVDFRCGLHVHLSWDGMTTTHVKNIVRRYAAYETQIDGWMPRSRKANNSRWCSSIVSSNYPLRKIANHQGTLDRMVSLAGRYYKVNLQSLGRYGTVEFRQHSGTTDYSKISAWVKFLMGFCEASKTARIANGVDLRYRASGKVYAAMRDQFAAVGYDMKWARGHNWDVFDADGNHVSRKVIAELDAMYSDKYLNQEFADWFNAIVNTDTPDDTVFAGVDTDTQDFLNNRAVQLAA